MGNLKIHRVDPFHASVLAMVACAFDGESSDEGRQTLAKVARHALPEELVDTLEDVMRKKPRTILGRQIKAWVHRQKTR